MRFLLLICTDPEAPAYVAEEDDIGDWVEEVTTRKLAVEGDRIRPVDDGRTVTLRDGAVRVAEGSTGGLTDRIAGFDLLECSSLDEAVDVASRHPMARFGRVEVRPTWPIDGL